MNRWLEGVCIILTVILVATCTALNNWSKERKFKKLYRKKKDLEVIVIRKGEHKKIPVTDIVVGDIIELHTGDQIPADGLVTDAVDLRVDESALTGEPDLVKKNLDVDPFMLSGCNVGEGSGKMLVTAVGPYSEWGKIMSALSHVKREKTPLEKKLYKFATAISIIGVSAAVFVFVVLVLGWLFRKCNFLNILRLTFVSN